MKARSPIERPPTVRVQSPHARMVNCSIPGRLGVEERVKACGSGTTVADAKETQENCPGTYEKKVCVAGVNSTQVQSEPAGSTRETRNGFLRTRNQALRTHNQETGDDQDGDSKAKGIVSAPASVSRSNATMAAANRARIPDGMIFPIEGSSFP